MLNTRVGFCGLIFLSFLFFVFSFLIFSSVYATDYDLSNSSNYDARFTNVAVSDRKDGIMVADVNGDSYNDIIISDGLASNNGLNSGSVYVIFGGADFSGDYDLSNSSNYNIRFDGEAGWQLGRTEEVHTGDVNGDGEDDLIISSYYPNSNQGSVFVIFSTLIDDFNGTTGNILSIDTDTDCPNNSCYNIRYNGSAQDHAIGIAGSLGISDLNGDNKLDLLIGSFEADYNGIDTGSYFVIFSTLIDDYTTTGNVLDLGTVTNYNIRFDGGTAGDQIGYQGDFVTEDISGDGNNDLIIGAYKADYGGTDAGSVYVICSTIIDDYADTGNNLSLSTPANYNVRYDGPSGSNLKDAAVGDVNGDSEIDLILGGNNYGGGDGMAWVLFSGLIDGIESSTGIITAVNTAANHNVRFEGDRSNGRLTQEGILIGDINRDGLGDLIMVDGYDGNALFVVYSTYLDDFGVTTGNYRDLALGSSFNIEYNGPSGDPIGIDNVVFVEDLDGDGYDDFIVGTLYANGDVGALWTVDSTKTEAITGTANIYSIDSSANYTDKYIGVANSYLTADKSVVISDINGDGGIDIIMGARGASSVYVVYGIPVNTSPNDPTSLGPPSLVGGGYTTDNAPTLTLTTSDPDVGDTVKYQIQIDNNSDFSSVAVDYTSALAAQGATSFTVGQAAGSGSYTTGNEGQTLNDGSYYWRVKAIDGLSAASSFATANSGGIAFKVDATIPTTPGTPSTSTPSINTTPTWIWTASSDSGSGLATTPYTIQWCTSSNFSGCSSNTATSSVASYTSATALSEGTWYFRIKASDLAGNDSDYSSNGSVVIDISPPSNISLDSPGESVNTQRPTFRWKTTSDSGSGLSKYKLEINNGDSGGSFTIDNISTSGTTDYENNKYIINYSGFSDGDDTNNYISVTTKSTTDWSSDQNDGKLKEGKRNWRVIAVDNAGNERSNSKDLDVDLTTPLLSNINISGSSSLFVVEGSVSDTKAGSNVNKSDYIRSDPDKIEIEIIRKRLIQSPIEANAVINLSSICDYSDTTTDTLTCSFKKEFEGYFLPGNYVVKVKGIDKAGNSSTLENALAFEESVNEEVTEEPISTPTPKPLDEAISEPIIQPKINTTIKKTEEAIRTLVEKITTIPKNIIQGIINVQKKVAASITILFNNPKKAFSMIVTNATNRIGYFTAAIFPGAKTQITEITIVEITSDSAVITWKTNHPATSKVNYGKSPEFEESVYNTTPVKDHTIKLEKLESNTEIFFEVISEGRTTSYDAYRIFKTKE